MRVMLCAILLVSGIDASTILNYTPFTGIAEESRDTVVTLRSFHFGATAKYLVVDVNDLTTSIRDSAGLGVSPLSLQEVRARYAATPYCKALAEAEATDSVVQDAGITHFLRTQSGIDLTVDLCPSKRPLDQSLFSDLFTEFGKVERPVPIAVSITAVWMKDHPNDLEWLLGLVKNRDITVTWVNHTCHHRVARGLPIPENFILVKGTDVPTEVLCTEKALLEQGMLPSVFFRFPGLVSDARVFRTVTGYGLIPVGSDAWLAKNQKVSSGSIVLVHANGNEPVGIRDFISLLRQEKSNIAAKRWMLYDLRGSTVNEEAQRP